MKFTLKLHIDDTAELLSFFKDMDMEFDIPFLDKVKNYDETISNYSKLIIEQSDIISSLQAQLKNLSEVTLSPKENEAPPAPAEQNATPPDPEVKKKRESPVFIKPAVLKPISCQTCGLEFVPHHNRVKWCPKCKAAKTAPSKKVNQLHQASD